MLPRSVLLLILVATLAAPSVLALPSSPQPVIVTLPGGWLTGYATPAMAAEVGGPLTFVNLDIMTHNVVSVAIGANDRPWCHQFAEGRCALFWADIIPLGSTEVEGLDQLAAGQTYDYYCITHLAMRGTLVALPAGA